MTKSKIVPSPLGAIRLTADDSALVALHLIPRQRLPTVTGEAELQSQPESHPKVEGAASILEQAAVQLAEYFAGVRTAFDLPLAPPGTAFQRLVWRQLLAIPHGETRSYGEIASAIGQPTASRAVGAANGRNPIAIVVPCHRVIGANGTLTGYAGGMAAKRWLLDHEQPQVAIPLAR